MLTLILGRAGTGKTEYILNNIKMNVETGKKYSVLIVPEQYSHDAERELAGLCSGNACLHAEVLSFSRLSNRVFSEVGGLADSSLDNGGRVLAMNCAIDDVKEHLKYYSFGRQKPDFIKLLINTYDEISSACVAPKDIEKISEKVGGDFGEKLSDLALVFESYERIKEGCGLDSRDRLQRLCEKLSQSKFGFEEAVYMDGFTDFTVQEQRIIYELLKKDCEITVSLCCQGIDDSEQVFKLSAETARRLLSMADRRGIQTEVINLGRQTGKNVALCYLEQSLFNYGAPCYEGKTSGIELWKAGDIYEECSLAAAKTLQFVKGGARFRDVSIVAPAWSDYSSIATGVFRRYGIPVNDTEKVSILEKPVINHVISALEIIVNNWSYNDVFRYIKSGFSGITYEALDLLENYVIKWDIRGSNNWLKEGQWTMHPKGYSQSLSEQDQDNLRNINEAREAVAGPIRKLSCALESGESAVKKARAIYHFLEDTEVYRKLETKVHDYIIEGELRLAQEYSQLWDVLINALTQFAEILGDSIITNEELVKLLRLELEQYEISTIPSSIDSVGIGDMSRMRRRGVKHLIVLGATDAAMPSYSGQSSVLADEEKNILRAMGVELADPENDTISRELSSIYLSLTMPSDSITISYPASARKSYIVSRIGKLFSINERYVDDEIYLEAVKPCFEIAAGDSQISPAARAAKAYFEENSEWAEKISFLKEATGTQRGRLARMTAEKLYGKKLNLSATKIDKFYTCKYSYFLQYGLKLKSRKTAEFDAPEAGTFMHYLLQKVAAESEKYGGFGKATNEELSAMAKKYSSEYAETKLGGFENKSKRFQYLFARLSSDAELVLMSMAEELHGSEFVPIDFELNFGVEGELPSIEIRDGKELIRVSGVVDRVDGWIHNGRLYLRVVDYKTGKKSFSLSDVYRGIGIQMLLYLFALCKEGKSRYNMSVEPAGVLYATAKEPFISAGYNLSDEDLKKARLKEIKRSGLLLDDKEVVEAMRSSTDGYLPVKFNNDGTIKGESLANLEMMGTLSRHIELTIKDMAKEIKLGNISADPYYSAQRDNACAYCDYFEACHFKDGYGEDKARYASKLTSSEVWRRIEEENNGRA